MVKIEQTPLMRWRVANNLTLEQAGKRFNNAHKATFLKWETGQILVPVKRLAEFEQVTGISRRKLRPDIFAVSPRAQRVSA